MITVSHIKKQAKPITTSTSLTTSSWNDVLYPRGTEYDDLPHGFSWSNGLCPNGEEPKPFTFYEVKGKYTLSCLTCKTGARIPLCPFGITKNGCLNESLFDFNTFIDFIRLPDYTPNILPKEKFKHCAFVGGSGALTGAGYGPEIDSADAVFRANMQILRPHTNIDGGSRTDFFVFSSFSYHPKDLVNLNTPFPKFGFLPKKQIGNASLIIYNVRVRQVTEEEIHMLRKEFSVLGLRIKYNYRRISKAKKAVNEKYPNYSLNLYSGDVMLMLMARHCEVSHVYGFFGPLLPTPNPSKHMNHWYHWVAKYDSSQDGMCTNCRVFSLQASSFLYVMLHYMECHPDNFIVHL